VLYPQFTAIHRPVPNFPYPNSPALDWLRNGLATDILSSPRQISLKPNEIDCYKADCTPWEK